MTRTRKPSEKAAGQLILAIQKVWMGELGTDGAQASEQVMHLAHGLLKGAKDETLQNILASSSIALYLGVEWVTAHPSVIPHVSELARVAAVQP